MDVLHLLWSLLSADELGKLGDTLARIEADDDQLSKDFLAWLQEGVRIATDFRKTNADAGPIIALLRKLK
jgi:hypothetical protein